MKKSLLTIAALMMTVPVYAQEVPAVSTEAPAQEGVAPAALPVPEVGAERPVAAPGMRGGDVPLEMRLHRERPGMGKKLEDKLNLTEEQKEQARKIHEKGMNEVKPILDEMRALREKADKLREENLAEFKAILTEEQLKIFESLPKPPFAKGPKKPGKEKGPKDGPKGRHHVEKPHHEINP